MSIFMPETPPLIHHLDESILDLLVVHIRPSFLAPEYGIDPSAHFFTHALVYIITADGKAIEANMSSPSALTSMGRMIIRHRPFTVHQHCFLHWNVDACPGLTVREVIRAIEEERRHIYRFHRSGLGCRFWVQTVMQDFIDHGFFCASQDISRRRLKHDIRYSFPYRLLPEKSPILRGKFL